MQAVEYDPFASSELEQVIPATAAQKEIWAATRLGDDASCSFNESISLHFHGDLDVSAFRQALQRVVDHHEALRGTFSPDDGRLCIATGYDIPLLVEDLSKQTPEVRHERLAKALAEEVETPLDLEHGPMVRVRLLRLAALEHRFIFTAHHIICDGWSMAVVLRDLGQFYSAAVSGRRTANIASEPFSAYARWLAQQQEAQRLATTYWLDRLQGELPVLQLPTDRPHPPLKTYRANRHDHPLPADLVQALKAVGAKEKASFFTVLLTSFATFLHRLTGQEDLIVGLPVAGQSTSGMENVVGHCVNLLPIRCSISPTATFNECLQQMRTLVLDGYDHQQVTYGELLPHLKIQRDASRQPLMPAAFNLDQAVTGKDLQFVGLEVEYQSNPRHFENFEIFINAAEAAGRVVLECQYNADLFDDATIRDRLNSFEALLAGVAKQPNENIGRLPMLSRAQLEKVLVEWNASALDFPREQNVSTFLAEMAARYAERPALTFADTTLTYSELDRRANRLAHHLIAHGAGKGTLVGLCLERSIEIIVGLLGILKTGAGYVPLDPKYPRERLGFMLKDSGASLVLTQNRWLDLFGSHKVPVLGIECEAAAIAAKPDTAPPISSGPMDIVYVFYTSGSTGTPKGVSVRHANLVNFLTSFAQVPGLNSDDVMPAAASTSFDLAVIEILVPFTVGARVVMASQDTVNDPRQLLKLLQTSSATVFAATPALWRMLMQAGWQGQPRLNVWSAGEALTPELVRALLERGKSLWNIYGPTETTVCSTTGEVCDPASIRVGKPIANTQIYIFDPQKQPVPAGVMGEVYIGGAGVSAGYRNRDDLTRDRFVENPYHDPFAEYPNPSLYRTGDLARWHRDGTIEYQGRNDHQVKLRGFRIEPGEIEAVLSTHPGIQQVIVMVRTDRPHDPRLVAYVVPAPQQQSTVTQWRQYLRERMPEYMIPQHFVELDELPLTSNAKVDRARLPPPFAKMTSSTSEQPTALTPARKYVLGICRELLVNSSIRSEDNFFQIGGHSLLAMQVLARFEKDTGERLSPRLLILNTLGQVADALPAERIPLLL